MFFMGSACYVLRDKIPLYNSVFVGLFVLLVVSVLAQKFLPVVYSLSLVYLVFWLVYVPSGKVRQFNRFGDYSYGIYIYAFPIQ